MSVGRASIRAMTGELELATVGGQASVGAGQATVVGELLVRAVGELPEVGRLPQRERLLVSAWLAGQRSARTRRTNAGDVLAWLG
jgi:hypothetical protein